MSGLNVFHQTWKDHLLEYRTQIASVRSAYFPQIIDNNQNHPRQLFNSINFVFCLFGKLKSYLSLVELSYLSFPATRDKKELRFILFYF